jgi:peptidoglycan/xylan/chitin deacetylase (PgdA/CDA1 family)
MSVWGRLREKLGARLLRPERGGVILAYHRIADVRLDPSGLSVSPSRFEAHMEGLARWARPRRLEALHPGGGETALRLTAAVTLDDGYADNLTLAKPILERYGIPATVFLPSGAVGRGTDFWWDELEALVFGPHPLPRMLDMSVGEERIRLRTRDDGGVQDRSGRYRTWLVWRGAAKTPRQRLYTRLWRVLVACPAAEQRAALDALAAWVGIPTPPAAHPTLDAVGIRRLLDGGLVELGAHTVSHPFLPARPPAAQREEIEESRQRLEEAVGRRASAFSYPYGAHDETTVALVRDAGFERAVTTAFGAVTPSSDPYRLPRLSILDWDTDKFRGIVTRYLLH